MRASPAGMSANAGPIPGHAVIRGDERRRFNDRFIDSPADVAMRVRRERQRCRVEVRPDKDPLSRRDGSSCSRVQDRLEDLLTFEFLTDRCYHAPVLAPVIQLRGRRLQRHRRPFAIRLGLNLDALLPAEYRHARRQDGPPGLTIADGRPPSALAPCQGRGGVNDLRNGTADDELLRRGSGMAPKPGLERISSPGKHQPRDEDERHPDQHAGRTAKINAADRCQRQPDDPSHAPAATVTTR